MVARRQQEPRTVECRRRADQRHQIAVCFGDGMAEKPDAGGIAGDLPETLNDRGAAGSDRIAQLAAAVEAVNAPRECVAGRKVSFGRRAHIMTDEFDAEWRPLDHRYRLTRLKADRGVETERPIVIGGLEETDAGNAS